METPAESIIDFVKQIGINVEFGKIDEEVILPGILVTNGGLLIDMDKLKYPGDILHEAGHLAVMPKETRNAAHINVGNDSGEEMMAIAWSYAAAVYINLDIKILFHPDGYNGGAESLIDAFQNRDGIGVPMLQYLGMTLDAKNAQRRAIQPFPAMIKWLRD